MKQKNIPASGPVTVEIIPEERCEDVLLWGIFILISNSHYDMLIKHHE